MAVHPPSGVPVHTYTTAGTYTVTLTASNGAGVDTVTRSGYITVSTAAIIPVAMFQANATSGNHSAECTVPGLINKFAHVMGLVVR